MRKKPARQRKKTERYIRALKDRPGDRLLSVTVETNGAICFLFGNGAVARLTEVGESHMIRTACDVSIRVHGEHGRAVPAGQLLGDLRAT
jgi:hypothetical protein